MATWPTLDGKPPLVIAHRGASGYLPEHTLAAYALAIDQGADVVEPDLVFTKDGVLVARHDRYLSTTTDIADHPEFSSRRRANDDVTDAPREDWWIEDFTLAELKTLRARQPFPGRSNEFDGLYEIPTFEEMLALVAKESAEAGRPVGVYPETKHPAFFASIGHDFEKPLLAALEGFDAGPVFIQSFEAEILKRLKGRTNAKLVQLVEIRRPARNPEPPTANIRLREIATYADGVGPQKQLLSNGTIYDEDRARSPFVEEAHALGLFVHPWTYRDDAPGNAILWDDARDIPGPPNFLSAAASKSNSAIEFELTLTFHSGVDGVFTDFPDTAIEARETYLKLNGQRLPASE